MKKIYTALFFLCFNFFYTLTMEEKMHHFLSLPTDLQKYILKLYIIEKNSPGEKINNLRFVSKYIANLTCLLLQENLSIKKSVFNQLHQLIDLRDTNNLKQYPCATVKYILTLPREYRSLAIQRLCAHEAIHFIPSNFTMLKTLKQKYNISDLNYDYATPSGYYALAIKNDPLDSSSTTLYVWIQMDSMQQATQLLKKSLTQENVNITRVEINMRHNKNSNPAFDNELECFFNSIDKNIKEKIAILDLSDNQLENFPSALYELINLEYLDMHNNGISTLSDDIGHLTKLKKLWIHNNQINLLPEAIGNLSSLEQLDLYNNKLSKLPIHFIQLKNLSSLEIGKNHFSDITSVTDITHYMPKLMLISNSS